MDQVALSTMIEKTVETLSDQFRAAARYILDHPRDVALLSMREQARQAGVQPATMTRFAKHLGLSGYDELRAAYAGAIRSAELGFAPRAATHLPAQELHGDKALADDILSSLGRQIEQLRQARSLDRIVAAAEALANARRVYCLGLRASHPVAWYIHYILSLIGERSRHLDGIAGMGADALANAEAGDVLLVASIHPYTKLAVELTRHAMERKLSIVAITDSEISPIADVAMHRIIVPTDSPSFFHAMSPAFIVAEVLAAIVAGRGGETTLTALRHMDAHLAALGTHVKPRKTKRPA